MIKPRLVFIGVFVCVMIFFYLIGAFAAWDMNAANWSEVGRLMTALVGTWVGSFVAYFAAERQAYYE